MHRIDPEVAGADLADDRVEIGAIAIDEGASAMDRVADRLHVGLEQAAGVRVGDHHRRDIRPKPRLEGIEVDTARSVCRDILDPVAGECSGGGIGAVSAFRHQHYLTFVAASFERGPDAEQAT